MLQRGLAPPVLLSHSSHPQERPRVALVGDVGLALGSESSRHGVGVKPDWRYLIGFLYLPSLQMALLGA